MADRMRPLLGITSGKEAKARKAANQRRPAPGEIFSSRTPEEEQDRLARAIAKSEAVQITKKQREAEEDRPQPGEILSAETTPEAEEVERVRVEKFLHLAKERFKLSQEAENRWRAEALDDLEFRVGKQWPADVEMSRQLDHRPCLTMNRLPAFIRQVTNEQRQQRPAIQVNPVGDNADTDTAETLQGVIRHIEVNSDAEIAYDLSFEQCVTVGIGWFRIRSDYKSPRSFDQELIIEPIENQFTVYDDPAATKAVREDARYRFVVEDVPISEYKNQYADTEAAGLHDFSSVGDNAPDWASKESIRVAEYFHIEEEMVTLYQLSDGTVAEEEPDPASGLTVTDTRQIPEARCHWAKINAIEIIDERVLPIEFIPVIPVLGDNLVVNGKRHIAGMVRDAKDPQRMRNYWVSAATEMIALAPKAPFVAAEGQIENHETEWKDSNIRNLAVLQYKPVSSGMQQVPAPQRQQFEPPVQAINMMTAQADNDLKAIVGIYDPSLGQNKIDQSGRAIGLLQKQGDISNLNWTDNLARSIRHAARILLQWIPKVYDAPRVQRIIKPDGSVDHVIVHNQQPEAAQALLTQSIQKIYDIGTGQYDVTVSQGPSYQTKRQEAVATQVALVQAYPQLLGVIGDLVIANMDIPQAKEMSKRLKMQLPPQLQDNDQTDPEQQVLQLRSQLLQLSQQHQAAVAALNQAHQIIQTKAVEQQGKADIEKLKIEAQIAIANIQAKAQDLEARRSETQQVWSELHNAAHDLGMQADQQQHDLTMQQNAPQPAPGGTQ